MTTKAVSTRGLKLQRGDGGTTEVFTTIGEITNIKGPSEKAPQLDATSFDSSFMEFISGLPDGGEVTFDCNFVGTDVQQQGLRSDLRAGTRRNFKIVINDQPTGGSNPTGVAFTAIVTAAPDIAGGVNAVLKSSCSLKVSGQPTWVYAA